MSDNPNDQRSTQRIVQPSGRVLNLILNEDEIQLLQMALQEYIEARKRPTVKRYVEQRYPESDYPVEFRRRKLLDVQRRIVLASDVRERLFQV